MKLVELIPEVTGHRVPVEQIEIFYRSSFMFVKLEWDKWVGTKDDKGKITIKFVPLHGIMLMTISLHLLHLKNAVLRIDNLKSI